MSNPVVLIKKNEGVLDPAALIQENPKVFSAACCSAPVGPVKASAEPEAMTSVGPVPASLEVFPFPAPADCRLKNLTTDDSWSFPYRHPWRAVQEQPAPTALS